MSTPGLSGLQQHTDATGLTTKTLLHRWLVLCRGSYLNGLARLSAPEGTTAPDQQTARSPHLLYCQLQPTPQLL